MSTEEDWKKPRQMFRAKCGACATIFDVAAIPMELGKFCLVAKTRSKYCPMCGSIKTFVADPRDLSEEAAA